LEIGQSVLTNSNTITRPSAILKGSVALPSRFCGSSVCKVRGTAGTEDSNPQIRNVPATIQNAVALKQRMAGRKLLSSSYPERFYSTLSGGLENPESSRLVAIAGVKGRQIKPSGHNSTEKGPVSIFAICFANLAFLQMAEKKVET
jgi:hypothetical protein